MECYMDRYCQSVEDAVHFLKNLLPGSVKYAVMLGSGLGKLTGEMEDTVRVPYADIPGFSHATIPGHRGELSYGSFAGQKILVFSGRFHCYQGYALQEVTIPVRIMKRLGVQTVVLTNSSGGINRSFRAGDIMLIRDHINLLGNNPLIGADSGYFGTPFIDMSEPYDHTLISRVKELAAQDPAIGTLREGVYIAVTGPSYETKAEIKFFAHVGADAVGMSTVPEVIVCAQEGIRVLGISVIANSATGIKKGALSHEEVLDITGKASDRVIYLIREVFKNVLQP